MGADVPTYSQELSLPWRELARDLLSREYREAMSQLVKLDLTKAKVEANVFHYGQVPGLDHTWIWKTRW